MRRDARRGVGRLRGAGAGLCALLVLAGCAAGAGTTASSAGGSSMGGGDGTVAATGSPLSVPIATFAMSGSSLAVSVEISVGGGDPVPVKLDTGSAGLLIDSSAVGSQVSATGGPFTQNYASGAVSGSLGTAVVGIGSASTAEPVTIGLVDPSSASSAFSAGTRGILGIATGSNSTGLLSPSLQLPAPYTVGSTLQVGSTAGSTGTWTLGPVTNPAGSTSIPLVAQSNSGPAPAGYPAFAKDVTLCWTVGPQPNSCAPTDLDTGNDTPALNATTYSSYGPVHTVLPSGLPVTMAASDGADPLWSFTTGATDGTDAVKLSALGADTQFNTGLPFFYGRTIAWNYASGQLVIGPAG